MSDIYMTTEMQVRPIESLKPYENNARVHDEEQIAELCESIRVFGFVRPLLITGDGGVLCGHGRLEAAKRLGMPALPCVLADHMTAEQRAAYILADNRLAEHAKWDKAMVSAELIRLRDAGFDISVTGFGSEDIMLNLPDYSFDDESFDPSLPDEPITKPGQVFQLGRHRLMCGDSTDINAVNTLFGGGIADITITSPPYGAGDIAHLRKHLRKGFCGRDGNTFYLDRGDSVNDWPDLMNGFMDVACNFSQSQFINIMMIADNKKPLVDFIYNHKDNLVDVIVWNKHTCPPQIHENVLNNEYEFVFVFDNDNGTRRIRYGDFKGTQSNYIETERQQNEYADIHKAVFGTRFVEKLLQMNGKASSVYDPFGGTGTTMIVCEQMNRTCYMMEIDPRYCDVIIRRWETLTGRKAEEISA